jgi:hypothetical protein
MMRLIGALVFLLLSTFVYAQGAPSLIAYPSVAQDPSSVTPRQSPNILYVDSSPESCTIDAVSYHTQLDCAFYRAVGIARSRNNSVSLVLGFGYYNTCAELIEPSGFYTIDLVGQSVRTTFINKTCLTPQRPVISKGEPVQFGDLVIRNLTIQANSLANSCMDIWGVNGGVFSDIACVGVRDDSDHMMQFGEPGHFSTGGVMQSTFHHVSVGSPYSERGHEARIVARILDGEVSSYSVITGGSGYVDADVVVDIYGYARGTTPCKTMPTARAVRCSGRGDPCDRGLWLRGTT